MVYNGIFEFKWKILASPMTFVSCHFKKQIWRTRRTSWDKNKYCMDKTYPIGEQQHHVPFLDSNISKDGGVDTDATNRIQIARQALPMSGNLPKI